MTTWLIFPKVFFAILTASLLLRNIEDGYVWEKLLPPSPLRDS